MCSMSVSNLQFVFLRSILGWS